MSTSNITASSTRFNLTISCELFRNVLEAFSYLGLSSNLRFTPNGIQQGLSGMVIDQPKRFAAQFFLHRHCLEMDEGAEQLQQQQQGIVIPLYFEKLVEFMTNLPKGYVLRWWPELRCLQGMNLDECKATIPFTYSKPEDVTEIPKNAPSIFPAVNLERYSFAVIVSKEEFGHQIESAVVNSQTIHIGICGRFLLLYSIGNGIDQKVIPATPLHNNHPYIAQGFNERDNIDVAPPRANATKGSTGASQLFYLGNDTPPCLVQQHSFSHFSFQCKSRNFSDQVIVAMSPEHGLVVSFPIRGYGLSKLNNKSVLQEESYFRYRTLPLQKKEVLPIPSASQVVLMRKLALDKQIAEKMSSQVDHNK